MVMAQCVPADLSLGLSFTTGAAVTGGLLAVLVDKACTTGSTRAGWHDKTQIEMQIRKYNRGKVNTIAVSRSSYVRGLFFLLLSYLQAF